MLPPSMRKSKSLQVGLRPAEYEHVKQFLDLKGIDCRDLLLNVTAYHALTKHKLQQGAAQ